MARFSAAENPLRTLRGPLPRDAAELYLIDATGLLQLRNTSASEEAFKAANKEKNKDHSVFDGVLFKERMPTCVHSNVLCISLSFLIPW